MKVLFHQPTQTIKPYPRSDDDPVVGLSPEYEVFDVMQDAQPDYDHATQICRATETVDAQNKMVTRGWAIEARPLMWGSAQQFMAAFTMEEKAAVALSTDPTLAALRLELSTWLSSVHADDARVIAGLNKLVELGIISAERKTEILATAS